MQASFGNVLGILLVLFAVLLIGVLIALLRRGTLSIRLRKLSAYDALEEQAGLAVESGGRLHISVGAGGISTEQTATTIAALTSLEAAATASVISDNPPLITTGSATTLPAAADTVQRAYRKQRSPEKYQPDSVQLIALDTVSMAAGATSLMEDYPVQANLLVGTLGAEAILMTEEGTRLGLPQTLGTDQIEGQAVALAATEHPLIGEELLAARGYLSEDASATAAIITQDILRVVVVIFLIAGSLLSAVGLLQ